MVAHKLCTIVGPLHDVDAVIVLNVHFAEAVDHAADQDHTEYANTSENVLKVLKYELGFVNDALSDEVLLVAGCYPNHVKATIVPTLIKGHIVLLHKYGSKDPLSFISRVCENWQIAVLVASYVTHFGASHQEFLRRDCHGIANNFFEGACRLHRNINGKHFTLIDPFAGEMDSALTPQYVTNFVL
jgi:hypothetical protein